MKFCDRCGMPIFFDPVWDSGRIVRWRALNPDGSDHLHSYETNEVPWQ